MGSNTVNNITMDQKIKNYLGVAIIVAVLALGYSALSYVYTFSRSAEPSSYRSFSVSGEGKVVTVPDVARFTFTVLTQGGPDLGALQKDNTEKVNGSLAFIKSKGVQEKDIKTAEYSVDPRYQYFTCNPSILGGTQACPPAEIVGYTVSQTVEIKARDFSKVGELISGVVEHGANSVSQLQFTLDEPDKAQSQAREQAIAKAKEKAYAVARAGGFGVGKLLSIDENGVIPYADYLPRGEAFASLAPKGAPTPPTIQPGSQEVKVNVTLRYEIR